jgi:hypothetical protein
MLKEGSKPYWITEEFQSPLNSQRNIVIIELVVNDAKEVKRVKYPQLKSNAVEMISLFQNLE